MGLLEINHLQNFDVILYFLLIKTIKEKKKDKLFEGQRGLKRIPGTSSKIQQPEKLNLNIKT